MKKLTTSPLCRGLSSFASLAREGRTSSLPSEVGIASNTIMSKSLLSKGSSSKARNPGFNTAHTYTMKQWILLALSH